MNPYTYEQAVDFVLRWAVRYGLLFGFMAILAMTLGACSPFPSVPNPLASGLGVRPPLEVGPENQTRNRLPQGGCDEKSDVTPTWSVDGFPQTLS